MILKWIIQKELEFTTSEEPSIFLQRKIDEDLIIECSKEEISPVSEDPLIFLEGNIAEEIIIECAEEEIPPDIDLSTEDGSLKEYFSMLEKNGCGFVAGYIARQATTSKKGPSKGCDYCNKVFVGKKELHDYTIFLTFKEYSHAKKKGLYYPSRNLYEAVKKCGLHFETLFPEVCHKSSVSKSIVLFLKEMNHDWCNCPFHGHDSWIYIINLLVRMKLYPKVKSLSKAVYEGFQRKRTCSDSYGARKKMRKLN